MLNENFGSHSVRPKNCMSSTELEECPVGAIFIISTLQPQLCKTSSEEVARSVM